MTNKKPDYLSQIVNVAVSSQSTIVPIETRVAAAWKHFEDLAARICPTYDILGHHLSSEFRDHVRYFIGLLYEASPGTPEDDCEQIRAKDAAYGGSWHRRGGTGAFHALARKGDRVISQIEIYQTFSRARLEDKTESIDDTLGDLRRYLILVEAWHVARERARMEPRQVGEERCVSCGHLKNSHYELSSESFYCGISGCRCTGYRVGESDPPDSRNGSQEGISF